MDKKIWAIPGFLGLAQDWDILKCKKIQGIELSTFTFNSLSDWAHQFNQYMKQFKPNPGILMGYSLGGRLALHALIENPQQWQGAIIISSHPGLENEEAKKNRELQDQQWVKRFKSEEWTSLMQSWNDQSVFKDSPFLLREEKNYNRQFLVNCLTNGSLSKQDNLKEVIAKLPMPILWLTGSLDITYCQVAQNIRFSHSHSEWIKIENSGHRIPWANPYNFLKVINNFVQKIYL